MPIDVARNLVFVHVPKTGGTSIEAMFSLNRRENLFSPKPLPELTGVTKTPQHLTWLELKRLLPSELVRNAYKAAFIRNPWDRFLSEYIWRKSWFSMAAEQYLEPWYRYADMESLDAFVGVLKLPAEQRLHARKGFDGHLETQRSFLIDETEDLAMTFIGRFETFERDVRAMAGHLGTSILTMTHVGRSRRDGADPDHGYRADYSDYARDAVAAFYSEDIETFGYEF